MAGKGTMTVSGRFKLALFTLVVASIFGVLATAWLLIGVYIIWWLLKDPDAGGTLRRVLKGEIR